MKITDERIKDTMQFQELCPGDIFIDIDGNVCMVMRDYVKNAVCLRNGLPFKVKYDEQVTKVDADLRLK